MDIHLLRCQQLRLYILKAARALLSHQDKLRQILCQPAVVEIAPNTGGMVSSGQQDFYKSYNIYLICVCFFCFFYDTLQRTKWWHLLMWGTCPLRARCLHWSCCSSCSQLPLSPLQSKLFSTGRKWRSVATYFFYHPNVKMFIKNAVFSLTPLNCRTHRLQLSLCVNIWLWNLPTHHHHCLKKAAPARPPRPSPYNMSGLPNRRNRKPHLSLHYRSSSNLWKWAFLGKTLSLP